MPNASNAGAVRNDWTRDEVEALFALPFNELLFRAHGVHRAHFDPTEVQVSTLLSIKTGACPEDCKYCPQSTRYDTGLEPEKLLEVERVLESARAARAAGASRFCMGAAWRSPKDRDLPLLTAMIRGVKDLGMETCMTLGMLERRPGRGAGRGRARLLQPQHRHLAGVLSRDHLDALLPAAPGHARQRARGGHEGLLRRHRRHGRGARGPRRHAARRWPRCPGIPRACRSTCWCACRARRSRSRPDLDPFEFVRTIAVARILMPASHVRLSAGRENMSDELQALAFFAGANSIFYGEKLLTTANPESERDMQLFRRLGLRPEERAPAATAPAQAARPAANALFYDAATA